MVVFLIIFVCLLFRRVFVTQFSFTLDFCYGCLEAGKLCSNYRLVGFDLLLNAFYLFPNICIPRLNLEDGVCLEFLHEAL